MKQVLSKSSTYLLTLKPYQYTLKNNARTKIILHIMLVPPYKHSITQY